MKLTKSKLKQFIKEELQEAFLDNLSQGYFDGLDGKERDSGKLGDKDYLEGYEKGMAERDEESDPRSSLGGMIDVDYEDPITAPRARGLEENQITKSRLQEIFKEEFAEIVEALPPHLQSKVDAYEKKKQKFSIIDRTPPGYGPDDPDEEDEPLKLRSPSQYGSGEDPMQRDPPSALRRKALRKERNEKRREDRSKHLEE